MRVDGRGHMQVQVMHVMWGKARPQVHRGPIPIKRRGHQALLTCMNSNFHWI